MQTLTDQVTACLRPCPQGKQLADMQAMNASTRESQSGSQELGSLLSESDLDEDKSEDSAHQQLHTRAHAGMHARRTCTSMHRSAITSSALPADAFIHGMRDIDMPRTLMQCIKASDPHSCEQNGIEGPSIQALEACEVEVQN